MAPYNKSKYVEAAQKLLNQGKVPQAIAEYQQILKYEPKDQVTLMTIGELYIRQGETFQAIDYFERLAQIFVGDGFLTKAIAVYKRIAKLAPEEIRPLEKLADLYVQQGVMSEARPLFLQLAEIHLKSNRQSEAVGLLRKLLQAEPDNLRIQVRLADLYQAMGQPKDAVEAYVSASQRALARGDHAECEKLADKALKIDAVNVGALTVKARVHISQGNPSQAAQILAQTPGLEKGGEQAELLLDLYVKTARWDDASALALRVFQADQKNFGLIPKIVEALLEAGECDRATDVLSCTRLPMVDAGEHDIVGKLLNDLAARTPGRIEPHEWIVETYGRTSDSFRLPDALAQLGDVLVANGKLDRAKEIFEQLVDREPESDSAKRKLNDVLRKLGHLPLEPEQQAPKENLQAEIPQPEAPKLPSAIPEPVVPVTPVVSAIGAEPPLDDETQKFIAQSLTDVDLFASYGLTQKAIGLLEAILRRAPRHTPTLEKLLDFVLGAGDDRRTAELAAQLEQIHQERGDDRGAERFGELRRRFQRAAGLTDEDLAAVAPASSGEAATPQPELPPQPAEDLPVPLEEPPATASGQANAVHEVDLSAEWESLLDETRPASEQVPVPPPPRPLAPAAPPPPPRAIQEFSIEEFSAPEAPIVEATQISAELPPPPVHEEPVALELPAPVAAAPTPAPPPPKPVVPVAPPEPELELEQDYELVLEAEPLVPTHQQMPPASPPAQQPAAAAPAQGNGFASDQFLADLANEIDQLGIDQLSPSFSDSTSQVAPHRAASAPSNANPVTEPGPLKEVFDEFRAELGEMGAEDEDLETHYNLGIAFREMGLLEEAISEFQKVAKATDKGRPFRYAMQCCTLLGLAFMDKGQPGIAAIWYERALHSPGVDGESALALRYDLGVAQESAGDLDAALKSFSHVYAMNIDYRDVGERIAALQKPIR